MFVQLGLQLISDMSMRIYSEASIAESPLLGAVFRRTNDKIDLAISNYPEKEDSIFPNHFYQLEVHCC